MKKKLLISWGCSYQFYGSIVPLIPKLAENFSIHLMFLDYRTPPALFKLLESFKEKKLIEKFWLLPDFSESLFRDLLRHHRYVLQNIKNWKRENYDVILASDDFSSSQRYLGAFVFPNKIHVCWIPTKTHLLLYEKLVCDLLVNVAVEEAFDRHKRRMRKKSGLLNRFHGLVVKASEEKSLLTVFKKGMRLVQQMIRKNKKRCIVFLDRILLPFLFSGRIFPHGPNEEWVQTGPGNCDVMIFCDEATAKAHTPLYQRPDIYMATFSTEGLCRCRTVQEDSHAILVGVGHGHEILENYLPLYERDIRAVLQETGANKVHLRSHPRAEGNNASVLATHLNRCGIDAVLVGNERPIWQIACDYRAVVGPLSESLRDARATCSSVPVACFMAVSDPRFTNLRGTFGDHQLIGWIEKDGSYDPDIFVRKKRERPKRKSVPEILSKLVKEPERAKLTGRS